MLFFNYTKNLLKLVAIHPLKVKFVISQGFRLCGVDQAFRSPWTFGTTSLPIIWLNSSFFNYTIKPIANKKSLRIIRKYRNKFENIARKNKVCYHKKECILKGKNKMKNKIIITILALSMLGMITGCDKKESDKKIERQTTKVESTTTEKGSKEKVVKGTEEKKTTTKKDNKNGEEETKEENKNKTTETSSNKEDVKKETDKTNSNNNTGNTNNSDPQNNNKPNPTTTSKPNTPAVTTKKEAVPVAPQVVEVSSVNISNGSLSIKKGDTIGISASVSPENANDKTINWSSSNDTVASVNGGNIVAKSAGQATITARSANGKIATCSVQVNAIDFDYTIQNGEAKIISYIGPNEQIDVVVPAYLEGCPVTEIGTSAFYGMWKINSITLPETMKIIGDSAFENCKSLNSINLPNGIHTIGKSSFKNCNWLASINIPTSMISIEYSTFYYCENVNSIYIPDNIKRIEERAFINCMGVKNLTIGSGIEYIGFLSFAGVNAEEIIIPENVQLVDDSAFKWCEDLRRMVFKNPNITFGKNIFQGLRVENITVIGYENSTAKAYAEEYGYKFELIQ